MSLADRGSLVARLRWLLACRRSGVANFAASDRGPLWVADGPVGAQLADRLGVRLDGGQESEDVRAGLDPLDLAASLPDQPDVVAIVVAGGMGRPPPAGPSAGPPSGPPGWPTRKLDNPEPHDRERVAGQALLYASLFAPAASRKIVVARRIIQAVVALQGLARRQARATPLREMLWITDQPFRELVTSLVNKELRRVGVRVVHVQLAHLWRLGAHCNLPVRAARLARESPERARVLARLHAQDGRLKIVQPTDPIALLLDLAIGDLLRTDTVHFNQGLVEDYRVVQRIPSKLSSGRRGDGPEDGADSTVHPGADSLADTNAEADSFPDSASEGGEDEADPDDEEDPEEQTEEPDADPDPEEPAEADEEPADEDPEETEGDPEDPEADDLDSDPDGPEDPDADLAAAEADEEEADVSPPANGRLPV